MLALTLLLGCTASAQGLLPSEDKGTLLSTYSDGDDRLTFIVELEGGGVLERREARLGTAVSDNDKSARAAVKSLQRSAAAEALKVTGSSPEAYLTYVANGFVVEGCAEDIEKLEALSGVKAVYVSEECFKAEPVEVASAAADYNPCADQYESVEIEAVRDQYSGKGTVIGILDSEFWYTHEAFGEAPQDPTLSKEDITELLDSGELSAKSLVSGLTADQLYKSGKIPFAFDYAEEDADPKTAETGGYHGTHVAGIAAASGDNLKGIASDAQIVFAKISKDGAGTMALATTLLALDDMAKIGVDVINMSFGSDSGFSDTYGLYTEALERLEKAGICIAASAGNAGRIGDNFAAGAPLAECPDYGLTSSPAVAEASTAVASVGVSRALVLDNETELLYYDNSTDYCGRFFWSAFDGKQVEYVDCGLGTATEFAAIDTLEGKVAFITRGGGTFSETIGRAQEKGAIAAVLANTEDVLIGITVSGCNIPCAVVKSSGGELLKSSTEKKLSMVKKGYEVSDFSSRGAAPDLRLKPELSAVGGTVYSAAYDNKYAYLSGTSMASPQYAGACAVALDYIYSKVNPDLSKTEAKQLAEQLLASTALPVKEDAEDEDGAYASPRAQGAGLINIKNAVETPSVVLNTDDGKTKIELGVLSGTTVSFSFKIKNISANAVTYTPSAELISDASCEKVLGEKSVSTVDGVRRLEKASVSFDCGTTVTVPAYDEKTVTATVTLDEAELNAIASVFKNGFFVEGFVILKSETEPTLSLPFMGFYGDWCALPIFSEAYGTENELYRAAVSDGSMYAKQMYEDADSVRYFSPNVGMLLFYSQNIRNIRTLKMTVFEQDGQTAVYSKSLIGVTKKSADSDYSLLYGFVGKKNDGTVLEDGLYKVKLEAYPDCEGGDTRPQTISFDIYLDSSYPQMTDAYLMTGTVNGTSGRWLAVKYEDKTGNGYAYSAIADANSTVSAKYKRSDGYDLINTTGCTLTDFSIALSDAAGNTSCYDISKKHGYAGLYDGLFFKGMSGFDAIVSKNIMLNRYDIEADENGYTKKLFVWDENMQPIAETVTVSAE